MHVRRPMVVAVIAAVFIASLSLATPAQAAVVSRVVSGTVECSSGTKVVRIGITSSNGGGGLATPIYRSSTYPQIAFFRYRIFTNTASTLVRLRVGCGGTASSPASLNESVQGAVVSGADRILNARCKDSDDTCSWPRQGTTRTTNPGDPGYCTWGAAEQWKRRTGTYPGWIGNAFQWDENARAAGWWVSPVPHARAVVVFEAGADYGSLGHVGYVTSVTPLGSGQFDVNIVEMNYPNGNHTFTTRTVRHGAGMSYIVSTI